MSPTLCNNSSTVLSVGCGPRMTATIAHLISLRIAFGATTTAFTHCVGLLTSSVCDSPIILERFFSSYFRLMGTHLRGCSTPRGTTFVVFARFSVLTSQSGTSWSASDLHLFSWPLNFLINYVVCGSTIHQPL